MTVEIEPMPGSHRLRVTGDLETVLRVPFEDDDRFLLGVSDGTLLLGTYDDRLRCAWEVTRDGAGRVRVDGDRVVVDSPVEWVTASLFDANVAERPAPGALPLFPDLDRWA
ncbi:hypothetical protein A9995_09010 [Erythrobacter sp. QSSC1-22B]|uniref:hypothetical protein n=1 Tax=Erythrobacter sp. QSSC1-22B TaxID=1860125 RepID=UPI000804B587|nr:hypothetical protein [Erythrobacter sp. QSSC1-22B]OBX19293.1 hypothetical protein A9995_09010 [Erythrobacter sp. QSSC1-22B]